MFALRFGAAFLYEFLRGERSVLDIMDSLRKAHWPLSLLYNLYCVPDVRIQSQPAAYEALSISSNFCDFSLGTTSI